MTSHLIINVHVFLLMVKVSITYTKFIDAHAHTFQTLSCLKLLISVEKLPKLLVIRRVSVQVKGREGGMGRELRRWEEGGKGENEVGEREEGEIGLHDITDLYHVFLIC